MLRKLSSRECEKICMSAEHNVPMHISLKPGTYEHTCPNCGQRTVFSIPAISWNLKAKVKK